jgi:hypothetical protein
MLLESGGAAFQVPCIANYSSIVFYFASVLFAVRVIGIYCSASDIT